MGSQRGWGRPRIQLVPLVALSQADIPTILRVRHSVRAQYLFPKDPWFSKTLLGSLRQQRKHPLSTSVDPCECYCGREHAGHLHSFSSTPVVCIMKLRPHRAYRTFALLSPWRRVLKIKKKELASDVSSGPEGSSSGSRRQVSQSRRYAPGTACSTCHSMFASYRVPK